MLIVNEGQEGRQRENEIDIYIERGGERETERKRERYREIQRERENAHEAKAGKRTMVG